jgi:hypothetical protein
LAVTIDGHYDREADIAWLRFYGYDPKTVVAEETPAVLRVLRTAGALTGIYPPGYLEELREEWPE